jgi:hypothetical protein
MGQIRQLVLLIGNAQAQVSQKRNPDPANTLKQPKQCLVVSDQSEMNLPFCLQSWLAQGVTLQALQCNPLVYLGNSALRSSQIKQ